MKNLAEFKRAIKAAKQLGLPVKAENVEKDGEVVSDTGFRPVGRSQKEAFTLEREDGQEGWVYYGKSSDWTFADNVATKPSRMPGRTFRITISKP